MKYRVVVSQAARNELRDTSRWWATHRSAVEAQRWYDGFLSHCTAWIRFQTRTLLRLKTTIIHLPFVNYTTASLHTQPIVQSMPLLMTKSLY